MHFLTTPIEVHDGYSVKREDLCCEEVPLSKMRGIYAHLQSKPDLSTVACVDTFRSWNGLCVAVACHRLNKKAVLFYPEYKANRGVCPPTQTYAQDVWGADVRPVSAGRQGVMISEARKRVRGYFMPTGMRLAETVTAVCREATSLRGKFDTLVVPVGTGTHLKGLCRAKLGARVIAVLGYSCNHGRLRQYVDDEFEIVDLGYEYRDEDETPTPFPANTYYETKAWAWMTDLLPPSERTLFWNIGGDRCT